MPSPFPCSPPSPLPLPQIRECSWKKTQIEKILKKNADQNNSEYTHFLRSDC